MASTVITGSGTIVSSNAAGSTLSAASAPVSNTYTAGQVITFSNAGAIIDTSNAGGSAGIVFTFGSVAGATDVIRNSGSIQAYSYGIDTTAHGSMTNPVSVSNSGIIRVTGSNANTSNDAGIFSNGGVVESVDNSGTIIATTGIFLLPNGVNGTFAVSNEGAIIATQQFVGGSYKYGIRIQENANGTLTGTGIITNTGSINGFVDDAVLNATITNAGTITAGVFALGSGTFIDAAGAINGAKVQFLNLNSAQAASGQLSTLVLTAGTVAVGTLSNPSEYTGFGYVTVANGADFQIGTSASAVSIPNVTSIADFGTLNIAGSIAGTSINMEGTVTGVNSVVDFTGTNTATPIYDYANNDEIIFGTMALTAPAAGSSFQDSYNTATGVLTVTEINASGASVSSASVSLTGAPGVTYSASSFDVVSGPGGETIALASSQIASGGSIYLDYGEHQTLANTNGFDNVNVTFGTHGSLAGPNVLVINGSPNLNTGNGNTFTTNLGTVSGFGLNDIITLGTANIPFQPSDILTTSYNTTTGAYTVQDQSEFARVYAATGNVTAAEDAAFDTVFFAPAGSYASGGFVETYGTNGINIETTATDAEQGYTFSTSGTADINTPLDYSGLVSPGDSIVSGEVVTIASGTATFATTTVVPAAGFTYASFLQNSGTILVAGTAATFTDYATLTGGGTIAAANGGHVNVLDNSGGTDAAQTLLFGTGGTSLAVNTIDLNGTSGTFAGTIAGFGTNDDIVIGPSLIPNDNSFANSLNNYVTLAYAGSLLTVGEVEYPGAGGTGTPVTLYTTLNVGTGFSVGSFVALYGTNGINIETASTVIEKPFTLVPTAGTQFVSFADPNQYVGGLAPGDSIISGETVIVNAGTTDAEIQNPVANNGNILINSGTLVNNGNTLGASDLTGTGTITVQNGAKFAQSVSGGTNTIAFGGDTTSNYNALAIGISATSFTSPITGFGSNDEIILLSSILPVPSASSSFTDSYNSATGALVINEFSGTGSLVGTATLTVVNTGSLNSGSFIAVDGFSTVAGSPAVDIFLGSTQLTSNSGSIYIDYGEMVTLASTSGADTIPVTFGTHGSMTGPNVLDLNSPGTLLPGNYYGDYTGTVSGFGTNDIITIGTSAIGSQPNDVLTTNYNTATGAYQIFDQTAYQRSPTFATSTEVVYFNPAGSYTSASFVETYGTNGINIETPATDAAHGYTFNAAGTADINTVLDYSGLVAPGSSIVSGEIVTIASGTATFASTIAMPPGGSPAASSLQNSGTILVNGTNAAFTDYATLTGGGTVVAANGGHVNVLDNSGGTDAAQTLQFGPGGTSLALNVIDLNPTSGTFAGTIAGLGLNDAILLGASVLPTVALGSGVSLAYSGSLLTVAELNSAGVQTASTTLNVGTGYSTGSFVALIGTTGAVTIETGATADETVFTFSTPTGTVASFENPLDYSGSVAPGPQIAAGETVIVASGTASISSANPVTNSGTIIVSGTGSALIDAGSLSGGGTVIAANGAAVTIASTAGTDAAQTLQFGPGGTSLALNTIDLNPTSGSFAGTIAGFGLNDDIVVGTSVLPSVATGSAVTLSYAGSLLTVGEVNSAGMVTASTTINVGAGYSASSFVALLGTNGINIETPATVDEMPLTFSASGTTASFENPADYAGGLAPGSTIVPGETVIIAAGTASIASTSPVVDNGTIIVQGTTSALIDSAPLTGTGTVAIANGGQVTLANTIGTDTATIYFGTGGTSTNPNLLDLTGLGTTSFGGTIANFGTFDTIILGASVLPGTETSFSTMVSGGLETLTVTSSVNGTLQTEMITFASVPPGVFTVSNSPAGILIADVPCFAAGTRILTGDGQVAVESIKVGDKVLTVRDGAEAEVVWVGSRTIDLTRHAMPEKVRPVRILAGAFGEGLPERDLQLSPDHALFIDGHLIEAKTLVNGVTVIDEKAARFVTYHHVELANHDIMLAEGLAAESYLDSGNRMMFESDAVPMMLHPDFAAVSRVKACAPLATDGDVVVAARARLLERAVALGFALTGAVDLTVLVAGQVVTPECAGDELLFVLPGGADSVELLSAVGVPAETSAQPGDRRALGVAVTGLALIAGGKRMVIALDDPAHTGFYAMENGHRWTNGAARVALPAYTGRAVLEVTINGQAARWVSAA